MCVRVPLCVCPCARACVEYCTAFTLAPAWRAQLSTEERSSLTGVVFLFCFRGVSKVVVMTVIGGWCDGTPDIMGVIIR